MAFKKLFFTAQLLLSSYLCFSQSDSLIESMMTRRTLLCADVTLNATTILPGLVKQGKTQLVADIITYWSRRCGSYNEPLTTFKILYSIENDTFRENLLQYYELKKYPDAVKRDTVDYTIWGYFDQLYVDKDYYPFIREWSRKQLQKSRQYSSLEQFALEFYANPSDSLLNKLTNMEFNGTALQAAYKQDVRFRNRGAKLFASVTSGVWLPDSRLARLGPHPYLGFQLMHRENQWDVYFDLSFRFINAPNYYTVVRKDSVFTTNKYFTFFAGAGCNYVLFRKNASRIDALAGLGYDGLSITLINYEDEDEKDLTKNIGSLNVNAGVGYRYFFRKSRIASSLGIELKYNFINYRNIGGTPLTGNAITIGLVFNGRSRRM